MNAEGTPAGGLPVGMAWMLLIAAGLFEVGWATSMKYTEGFTKITPTIVTIVLLAISMILLAIAQRVLPLGSAYAVWVGIGALGAVIVGIVIFREPVTAIRIVCVVALVGAIIGLKLTSAPAPSVPPAP